MGLAEDEREFWMAHERMMRPIEQKPLPGCINPQRKQFVRGYAFNPIVRPKVDEFA